MNLLHSKVGQRQLAEDFRAMHHAREVLVLAGAWDVASAKVYEIEGFKAIGTTSAGIAASLGFADGEQMCLEDNIAVLKRIVRNIDLPVSADIEAGYADCPAGVADAAGAVIEAGAVGLNVEDGVGCSESPLCDISDQQKKIQAIRKMADDAGVPLVINARTDAMLSARSNPEAKIQETVARANAYREAGADCIFVPDMDGLSESTIQRLVKAINAPLNLIAGPNMPDIAGMQAMGVARVSLGPRPMRALLSSLRNIAGEIVESGTYRQMSATTLTYGDVNAWFDQGNRDSRNRALP